jgi:hypothetical protein
LEDRKGIGGERYRRGLGEAAKASGHRARTVSIRVSIDAANVYPTDKWTRKRWSPLAATDG